MSVQIINLVLTIDLDRTEDHRALTLAEVVEIFGAGSDQAMHFKAIGSMTVDKAEQVEWASHPGETARKGRELYLAIVDSKMTQPWRKMIASGIGVAPQAERIIAALDDLFGLE